MTETDFKISAKFSPKNMDDILNEVNFYGCLQSQRQLATIKIGNQNMQTESGLFVYSRCTQQPSGGRTVLRRRPPVQVEIFL